MDKEKILKSFSEFLDNMVGGSKEKESPQLPVMKALDQDKKQATFVVLHAYSDDSEYDLHNETYDADEVEKACHNYNRNCMKANLGHLMMVEEDIAYVVESYCSEIDMVLGDQFIAKGTWLQKWQFNDDSIWEGVKGGQWNGLSIQCMVDCEDLENE
jgi:hypothetical protein